MPARAVSEADFEKLAHFRYRLGRFLRFSKEVTREHGITMLQYLLMLQIKAPPRREWPTVGELAERLQTNHHRVVSLVSRCEAAGLVKRNVGRSHKRQVEVALTRVGERCLARLVRLHLGEFALLQAEFAAPALIDLLQAEFAAPVLKAPGPGRPVRNASTGGSFGII